MKEWFYGQGLWCRNLPPGAVHVQGEEIWEAGRRLGGDEGLNDGGGKCRHLRGPAEEDIMR